MTTFYRVCLWFARFDLTMAEAVRNYTWISVARQDVSKLSNLLDEAEWRKRLGC